MPFEQKSGKEPRIVREVPLIETKGDRVGANFLNGLHLRFSIIEFYYIEING